MRLPGVVIGAVKSGSGKTTLVAGLLRALQRRGVAAQPFKVGPDYIDPGFLSLAAGRPCRNLDDWLLPADTVREVYRRAVAGVDLAVVEGVMGLFDGGDGGAGSTAGVARLLGLPVILVLEAASFAQSAAAVVLGFREMDPQLRLAGVILNGVGSASHRELLARAIEERTGVPVLGALARLPELEIPSRHLGLVPVEESARRERWLEAAADAVDEALDWSRFHAAAARALPVAAPSREVFARAPGEPVTVAVARDEAFSFYYQDGLDYLVAAGARLAFFSPRREERLPEGAAGLILGGGFPEVFAAELSANRPLAEAVRRAHAAGMPIYAECGGLLYLAESLAGQDGRSYPLVGLVPAAASLGRRLAAVGYREGVLAGKGLLGPAGRILRGHEFHYSTLHPLAAWKPAFRLRARGRELGEEGYRGRGLHASYLHLHWAGCPQAAGEFLDRCRAFARRRAARKQARVPAVRQR